LSLGGREETAALADQYGLPLVGSRAGRLNLGALIEELGSKRRYGSVDALLEGYVIRRRSSSRTVEEAPTAKIRVDDLPRIAERR
jgi:hypothetical protein